MREQNTGQVSARDHSLCCVHVYVVQISRHHFGSRVVLIVSSERLTRETERCVRMLSKLCIQCNARDVSAILSLILLLF